MGKAMSSNCEQAGIREFYFCITERGRISVVSGLNVVDEFFSYRR